MTTKQHSAFGLRASASTAIGTACLAIIILLVTGPRAPAATAVFTNINAGLPGIQLGMATWGDYDNDGWLDLFLAGEDVSYNPVVQLRRNAHPGMTNVVISGLPYVTSFAWGDYDNDGRLDLVVAGTLTDGTRVTQVWHNNGNGSFTNINAQLTGISDGSVAWGDYDNDGRLDILLAGETDYPDVVGEPTVSRVTEVWRNNGDGTFSNINAGLPGIQSGAAAWGDFDNDGRLDILLAGDLRHPALNVYNPTTQLWRNTGNGFTNVPIPGLPPVRRSSVAWGDFDNDGLLDFMLVGADDTTQTLVAQVWRNTGGGFTNINAGLPGIIDGSIAWGDYDNDGRLDILLAGSTNNTHGSLAQVWRNTGSGFTNINAGLPGVSKGSVSWGDYDGDGRLDILLTGLDSTGSSVLAQVWRNTTAVINNLPTAPATLTARVLNRHADLSWAAATDAQTPSGGLSYNLRVGTSTGACDLVSAQAIATNGLRLLPAFGNRQHRLTTSLSNLADGDYYWSAQAVDTALAGSPFANEGHFSVYRLRPATLAAANITITGATLSGTINRRGNDADTSAWFEYGLGGSYGSMTTPIAVPDIVGDIAFSNNIANLSPWMTYHYRAVGSNGLGRVNGPDMTFTVPGPGAVTPYLSGLPSSLTIAQGGSTLIPFTASPAWLDVQVHANNPVLLPAAGLKLLPYGGGYNLSVVPDPAQSGSALITVTASDGSQTASQTIPVTVTPGTFVNCSPLLCLTNQQVVSAQAWRFRLADWGTGHTNYAIEYRPDLGPTSTWMAATNVTKVGNWVYEVAVSPPQRGVGFYRARGVGFRLLTAGFDSDDVRVGEGGGTAGPVLVFNDAYTGWATTIWTDGQGATLTNQVWVNGTTAVIPAPASYLAENSTIGQLQYLTLQLVGAPGFTLGATTQTKLTIEENDAEWQGALQVPGATLDFGVTLVETNGTLRGQIQSDGFGFLPTNRLAQLNFTSDAFTLVATNIPMPTLTAYLPLGFTNYLDLRLDAANSTGVTNVSPTLIQGIATVVSKVPNRSYLDAPAYGTFQLSKPPTAASTNDLLFYTTNGVLISQ